MKNIRNKLTFKALTLPSASTPLWLGILTKMPLEPFITLMLRTTKALSRVMLAVARRLFCPAVMRTDLGSQFIFMLLTSVYLCR